MAVRIGRVTDPLETRPIPRAPAEIPHRVEDRPVMPQSKEPLAAGTGRGLAGIRDLFNRLTALWAAPRIGRVALCSPVVGLFAGLGAVGFLLSLQFMYDQVLGGWLH